MKKYYLLLSFLFSSFICFSQNPILCEGITAYLKFESEAYVPTVAENENGTVTLVFSEDYITNIFAKYNIYKIKHVFASSTYEELQNIYEVNFNSRDLIIDVTENIPNTILHFQQYPESINIATIPEHIISALNGYSFNFTKYNSIDESNYGSPMQDVPDNFNLKISFNYNASKDVIYVKSDNITPCGNEFLIGLYGVNKSGVSNEFEGFQLWETISITNGASNYSQPCHAIESSLYYALDFCSGPDFSFTSKIEIDNSNETSKITLRRGTPIFGEELIELSQESLSLKNNSFKHINLITSRKSSYLKFSNLNNSKYFVEIYSVLGEKIINKTRFKENAIHLNTLKSGLYIIKLSNPNNEYKTFKLIK